MKISKNKLLIISASLLITSVASLFGFAPTILGGFCLLLDSILFFFCLNPILKRLKISPDVFVKSLFILVYYLISLSLIYYITGLSRLTILIWLLFNFGLVFYYFYNSIGIKINFPKCKLFRNSFRDWDFWLTLVTLFSLAVYFFSMPIIDGTPTPWPKTFFVGFFLFFVASFLLIRRLIAKKEDIFLSFLYFFLIIGLIATRYVLSYGYDTLIHQGALKYIAEFGQVKPLTPFYIGQYVLEVLTNMFSGFSFTFLERWLGPILFLFLTFFGGHYFLKRLKLQDNFLLIPVSVVLLFPNIFSYTSPYAISLLWGVIALLFIFLFLNQKDEADLKLAIICSLASFFVHPFVGLNILIWSLGLYLIRNIKLEGVKRRLLLGAIFITASLAVIFSFILYNWLQDNGLNIYNPLYFIGNFANIFNDPVWYLRDNYSWQLGLIYFYEKVHFFLIFFLALYFPLKKMEKNKGVLILVSASTFISAWFFVSSFKIDNYFYGDQVNYGYRLIQVAKWFLWPIVLIGLSLFFTYLKKIKAVWRYLVIILVSILLTISWYLTYPRQDAISHMNVNSIRSIDYQAIDLIYKNENGKNGYVVLSNQIFGAGAILKYGFGPYYKVGDENIFYYSLPWGGKLSSIYNEIMTMETKSIDKDLTQIKEIITPLGINKFYVVYTDAWSPAPSVIKQLNFLSSERWNIDNKIFIILIRV